MSVSTYFTTSSTPIPNYESHQILPMSSILRRPSNINQKTDSQRILEIVNAYENKYKVFTALNYTENAILDKISNILLLELNIDIKTLFCSDFYSFLMILSSFYGRREALNIPDDPGKPINNESLEEEDYISDCKHPLHTILVMCFATYQMQKVLEKDDFGQKLRIDKFENLNKELEELACKILNHLYLRSLTGPGDARQALEADFQCGNSPSDGKYGYDRYLNNKFNQSMEIMAIAYKAKAMKFLSQRPCLNYVFIRKQCKNKSRIWRPSVREKLYFHALFRIIYVCMFAYMLCRVPFYDNYLSMTSIPFFYVLSVSVTQVLMTIFKLIDFSYFHWSKRSKGSLSITNSKRNVFAKFKKKFVPLNRYFRSNTLAFFKMVMGMFVVLLEVIRLICFGVTRKDTNLNNENFWYSAWNFVPISLELIYCTLFAIAVVSSLQLFHFLSSLGFFVHLFKKMYTTVGMFVLIFSTFWVTLSVIHVSLSRTLSYSNNTMLYTIVSEGKFEIFGEVQDKDREGTLRNCEEFNRTILDFFDMHYAEASCLFRSSIMPFLVFAYMFVAGILLINLLTAQLTKEYEKESENSQYYKGYLEYEQLSKIESKLFLPPPLSLVYIFIRLLSYCSNWMLVNVVERMEGYPWGSVRDSTCDDSVEELIKQYLSRGPETVFRELKDVISKYGREGVNAQKLEQLQNNLNAILDAAVLEDARATLARSRACTRADYDDPSVEVLIGIGGS